MLSTSPPLRFDPVAVTDRAFYEQLGQRIAILRKTRGLTQVQLAGRLGVAQQTLAHYEAGRLRLLAGALPILAEHLDTPIDALLGETRTRSRIKRGPAPKIQQQLEQVARLPKAKQRFVSQVIDSVLAQAGR
jgi:transcriptional regulator with XRE-family HTH domain